MSQESAYIERAGGRGMQTELKVLNWNIAGAKYFTRETDKEKAQSKEEINKALQDLVHRHSPDVITLQETADFGRPGEPRQSLVEKPPGYEFANSILIDSERHPYVAKWRNIATKGHWPDGSYFGQGNGTLWRTDRFDFKHFAVWDIPGIDSLPDGKRHIEDVILMSGLYFGDRNTEPRAAAVTHFILTHDLENPSAKLPKPLDVFVVNLHLTTLKNEREGLPEIDERAARIRAHQLDIILNGIVSRYNLWRSDAYKTSGVATVRTERTDTERYSPVWILCGDFNFSPDSEEFHKVTRANFVDVCPQKGGGSKASGFGKRARLTLDYIFAGPKFVSLDPVVVGDGIAINPIPDYTVKASDHYPLFASVPLTPR